MAGFDAVLYALLKKYIEDSIRGITGVLAGKNCTIESAEKVNGVTTIIFKWTANDGTVKRTQIEVEDGTPIYTWTSGDHYENGDLIIRENKFYKCIINNEDVTFDDTKWELIGSPDGNYSVVESADELPTQFSSTDRKMYYVVSEQCFYLWNGTKWVEQESQTQNVTTISGRVESSQNGDIQSQIEELSYRPDTQAYAMLFIDDARVSLPNVWNVIKEYGIVVNLAVPTNTLGVRAADGRTIAEVLHEMEAAGCEIHSHSIDYNPLDASYTKEDVVKMLKDSKEALLKEGFNVHGFCAPGGTDGYKWEEYGWSDLVRQYYLYSDCRIFPYRIHQARRVLSKSTDANLETAVRLLKNSDPALSFFFHDFNDLPEERLRHFIEYAQAQGVQFITQYDYYKSHIVGINSDRLNKLEIGDLTPYSKLDHWVFEKGLGAVNYDRTAYPYAFVYNPGGGKYYIVSDSVLVEEPGAQYVTYKKADGTVFKMQRYVYRDGVWTKDKEQTVTSFVTYSTVHATVSNFDIYGSDGTLIKEGGAYYDYHGVTTSCIDKQSLANTQVSYYGGDSVYRQTFKCECTKKADGSVDVTTGGVVNSGPFFNVDIDTNTDNIIEFSVNGIDDQELPNEMAIFVVSNTMNNMGNVSLKDNKYVRKITKHEIDEYGISSPMNIGLIYRNADVIKYNVSVKNLGDDITVSDVKDHCFYHLKGKKVIFLGDSITAFTKDISWVDKFCDLTACVKVVNVAVSSAVLADYENTELNGDPKTADQTNNTLCNQVQKIIENNYESPDLIIIAIGTNNGINVTEQEIKNSYMLDGQPVDIDSLDRTTIAGAFRWANEKLRSLYPNAMIFWCNPIQGAGKYPENVVKWANNLRMLTEYGAVENVTTNRCGINWATENAAHTFLSDGLHPNSKGAMKMALYNAAAITGKFFVTHDI